MPHLFADSNALPMRSHDMTPSSSALFLLVHVMHTCAQVVEATACKAVMALGSASSMRSSGLLDMTASASKFTAAGDPSAIMDWGMLEWLPRLKEWSLLAFLICPGGSYPCWKHQRFLIIECIVPLST